MQLLRDLELNGSCDFCYLLQNWKLGFQMGGQVGFSKYLFSHYAELLRGECRA